MNSLSKAWTFLTLGAVLFIYAGHSLAGHEGLLWGVAISLSINCYLYFFGDRQIIERFPGQEIEGQDAYGIINKVQKLAAKARVPLPRVVLIDSPTPQALALGHNWRNSSILLTEGLAKNFTEKELEAVLAYQIVSIRQMHTFLYSVFSAVVSVVLTVTRFLDSALRFIIGAKKGSDFFHAHFFSSLVAPLISFVMKLSIRGSYFEADKLASELTGDPQVLAEVLWKLDSYAATRPLMVAVSLSHLFMVNPLTRQGWTRYFRIHPTVKSRIVKLVGRYPI